MIVNSTTFDCNLGMGALSKAILNAAGSAIQNEARAQIQGELKPGEFVVTSSGNLSDAGVKHILHAYVGMIGKDQNFSLEVCGSLRFHPLKRLSISIFQFI